MKEIFEIIKNNSLFENIGYSDLCEMFNCLNYKVQNYDKKETIFLAGNPIEFIGIVIFGSANVFKEDLYGNSILISEILPGEMFGETFACAEISHSPVTVVASNNSRILFINYKEIISICKNSCIFHRSLIENMLKIIAQKNLFLNKKIDILSKKTIREKLLCFFDYERKGNQKFSIIFNREELASYIGADRSAMCAELSRMQKDGILKYHKNNFELLY